jgi:Phage integrase, N-terminal SAM-like domain
MARAKRKRTKYQAVYYRDLPEGRVYDINHRAEGKLRWESGFPTLEAALDRRDEVRYATRRGIRVKPTNRLYREFVKDDYLPRLEARVAQGELRSSTATQYKRDIRNHLLPEFGPYRLDQIDVEQVERFRDKLTRRGLSNDSIKRVITTLGYTLKLARKWRLIQYNPVADADKPRARRRTPTLPTVDGIERLALAMPTRETTALVLFAAFTGEHGSQNASRSAGATSTSHVVKRRQGSSASSTRASLSTRPRRRPARERSSSRRAQRARCESSRLPSKSTSARTRTDSCSLRRAVATGSTRTSTGASGRRRARRRSCPS